ncbi:DNA cytosine methyltransferase [Planktomarina temperata]|nr:DNA cytosine methyltransferase [Planktomarina temperata]
MKIVSLFSGCGGLDLGFINAGFDVIWANDIFLDAVATYRKNIGDHITSRDIKDIDLKDIPSCDGIIGGFPCQGFSIANMGRHVEDERNALYLQFIRVVRDKKPKFFIAENVKGILTLGKGAVFEKVKKDFGNAGYKIHYKLFNTADYGVPQKRERVILFGVRNDIAEELLVTFPPEPTHAKSPIGSQLPWIGCGEALIDIPEPSEQTNIANHEGSKYKLRFNGYLGHRKIDPMLPAPTVTARGDEKGGVVIIHHPNNHRRMTVRETAIIQSFPLDFIFEGTKTSAYRQIGNAVPPLFGQAIAESVVSTFGSLES